MTSKKALTLLIPKDIQTHIDFRNNYNSSIKGFILKDLDRKEELEKENKYIRYRYEELEQENQKLKEENQKLKEENIRLKWKTKELWLYEYNYLRIHDLLDENTLYIIRGNVNAAKSKTTKRTFTKSTR